MKIIYFGRYELPDKDATANRVVANAKIMRALGHDVILAGWSKKIEKNCYKKSQYFGFECYEKYQERTSFDKFKTFTDARNELFLLKLQKADLVIAYNFPAVALKKIMKYCKKHAIKCIADVTEWFANYNPNPFFRVVKAYDSYLRMKVLHKKADGLIVISKYLEKYYAAQKTVLIPPLVDKSEPKWLLTSKTSRKIFRLVYAGWPSKVKERLDLLVNSIEKIAAKLPVQLDIYGINEQDYRKIYSLQERSVFPPCIIFHGKVSHQEAIQAVKDADYSLIIRESSRKNNAGFPSKLVESISCGTPVLTTAISNVADYVHDGNNGYIISIATLEQDIEKAVQYRSHVKVNDGLFDCSRYISPMAAFLNSL
ncbi:MAG: hypothetical protein DBX61_11400 [Clostridiales bacterium]|nr:MAG: hypothetical protein DBX61_11400 [Clostridiales bacterium]